MNIKIIRKVKHYLPSGFGYKKVDRKVGRCLCGREVELLFFTNTCECGRDYNMLGQLLASREQWGEETGESVSDILAANSDY